MYVNCILIVCHSEYWLDFKAARLLCKCRF